MTDAANPTDSPTEPSSGSTSMPTSSALGMVVDGRYRIVEPLAEGGMGSVYLGLQENLNRRVAIKRVSQPEEQDAERFRREAEALAAVSHPAIVEVYDYINEPTAGVSFLIMAYVDGENLEDYIDGQPHGVVAPLESLGLMVPVASAMVELHSHEILHRDIKPANLVRYERADRRAAVKLVDFGIARRAQDPGLTAAGLIVGTPPYLSPEVILGKGHSEASDVYAFGATLFELLTGEPPHGKDDLHQILKHATQEDVTLPSSLNATPLGTLLLRVLNREEEGRPTMQSVLDELEQIRLTLLMESDDPQAPLRATRNISAGTMPPGFGQAVLSPETATAAINPLRSAQTPTRAVPPGATALVSQPEAGLHTLEVPRLRAASDLQTARQTPVVPWILAGVMGVVAVVVTILLLVSEPEKKKPEETKSVQNPIVAASMNGDPDTMDRPAPPRPNEANTSLSGVSYAKAAGELLAGCTSLKKATNLFYKADRRRRKKKHHTWAKAAFTALLQCRYAISGQKMWGAYRLAKLHAKDGECDAAARAWRQWVLNGGTRKNGHLKKPKCQQK
jgi:serine/threonine protein kinase